MVAAGRRSHARALDVWANDQHVGQWRVSGQGEDSFQYATGWMATAEARPLSLSLAMPLDANAPPLRGARVRNYFDNLLPDSEAIRARLQARFRTVSKGAFDLLQAIGRDCVGAVQLLPEGIAPDEVFRIEVEPLDEAGVERMLRAAVAPARGFGEPVFDADDFRISIAGTSTPRPTSAGTVQAWKTSSRRSWRRSGPPWIPWEMLCRPVFRRTCSQPLQRACAVQLPDFNTTQTR